MIAFGGRLPVNVFNAVACDIFAKLFKVASAADLTLAVYAESTAIQKERGEIVALARKVWVNAHFSGRRQRLPVGPKAQWRRGFNPRGANYELAAFSRSATPVEYRPFRAC